MPLFYIAANGDKMSVLKNKRKQSKLEFFHNAYILRNEITLLLLRDFGIKDKIRTVSKEPFILKNLIATKQLKAWTNFLTIFTKTKIINKSMQYAQNFSSIAPHFPQI